MIELQTTRAAADAELKAISRPGHLGDGAPAGVPQEELVERQSLLQQIVRGYDQHVEDRARLEKSARRKAEIERAAAEWQGFPDPPPYPVFLTDQLWQTAFSLRRAAEGIESQLSLMQLRFDRARDALQTAEQRLRQATEQAEAAKDPAQVARLRWTRDLDALRQRAAAVQLAAAELSTRRIEAELAETRAKLVFAERQAAAAEPLTRFAEEDLKKAQERLAQERQALEADLQRTLADQRAESQVLQELERRLEALQAKRRDGARAGAAQRTLARAQGTVELKRAQIDTLVAQGDLLRQLLDLVEGERQLWEARFAASRSPERSRARDAYARFAPLFHNLEASRDYLRQEVHVVSGLIADVDHRLRTAPKADRTRLAAVSDAYRRREEAYDRALQRLDQTARFTERWKAEVREQREELPWSARLEEWLRRGRGAASTLWTFEVFSAEDSIEVDGKKLTGRRSITVGKILTALAILVIGYWICLYLARLTGRLAATKLGLTPDVANLVRQWTQALLITLLIVISLVSVKIPLTIFAFLGGAFAIGVGFGAQTLLKNVISGVLVLIERPFRVGDVIELDNVRGRVTSIGLRSSTVRDAKGMETLIPNSSFLERHLTNWTYSSRISRHSLRVTAPYEAPTDRVIGLLASLTKSHPQVLKVPEPQVLLEEFGDRGRVFMVNYWLEIRLDIDPSQVASELKLAVEQAFQDAGLKALSAA